MGFGIAASIGVSLATGRSRTFAWMAMAAFSSTFRSLRRWLIIRLPLKFFVLNNDGYAAIRSTQNGFFGGPNIGCDPRRD